MHKKFLLQMETDEIYETWKYMKQDFFFENPEGLNENPF